MAKGKQGRRKSQAWLVGVCDNESIDLVCSVKDKADGVKVLKNLPQYSYGSYRVIRLISGMLFATVEMVNAVTVREEKDLVEKLAKGEKANGKGTE